MQHIKIGTLVGMDDPGQGLGRIEKFIQYGFETISLTFWQTTGGQDLAELAESVRSRTDPAGVGISSLSVFGNPLVPEGDSRDTPASWERLIDAAPLFGADLVTGFAGRLADQPIGASIPAFKRVFGPLAARAADRGVRLAFENCPMEGTWHRGDWNIAVNPDAWELMFDALPVPNIGLQWEPCHQLCQLIDPIPQLRRWAPKVFNVHGKDATVAWDVVKEGGAFGRRPFAWHRTPGFGDSNWSDIVTILMQAGYGGSIDIEGYHDPVHGQEWELASQVRALRYLKDCRGGDCLEAL